MTAVGSTIKDGDAAFTAGDAKAGRVKLPKELRMAIVVKECIAVRLDREVDSLWKCKLREREIVGNNLCAWNEGRFYQLALLRTFGVRCDEDMGGIHPSSYTVQMSGVVDELVQVCFNSKCKTPSPAYLSAV